MEAPAAGQREAAVALAGRGADRTTPLRVALPAARPPPAPGARRRCCPGRCRLAAESPSRRRRSGASRSQAAERPSADARRAGRAQREDPERGQVDLALERAARRPSRGGARRPGRGRRTGARSTPAPSSARMVRSRSPVERRSSSCARRKPIGECPPLADVERVAPGGLQPQRRPAGDRRAGARPRVDAESRRRGSAPARATRRADAAPRPCAAPAGPAAMSDRRASDREPSTVRPDPRRGAPGRASRTRTGSR